MSLVLLASCDVALVTVLLQMSRLVCVSAFVDTSGVFNTEPSSPPAHSVGGGAGGVSVKQEVYEGRTPGQSLLSPLQTPGCV